MRHRTILASAAATLAATTAMAGPLLTVNASVGGFIPMIVLSNGASTSSTGRYSYIGGIVNAFPDPSWAISWDLVGDDTAVFPTTTFITNGFRVQNLTSSSQTYDIVVALASSGPSDLTLDCNALLGATLTNDAAGNTATLASLGATPMWVGQINGISRATTGLNANSSFSTTTTRTVPPAISAWSGVVDGTLQSVGYRMQFTLTGKSTALFTGFWDGAVVPSPGAIAMIFVAGGFASARRRKTD